MGGEDFVKKGSDRYKACDISSTNAPSCPRLSLSACKAASSPPFSTPPAPDDPLSPPSAVARLTPKPGVQLLVGNRHPQLPPTPCHRLPYRPKPPLQYRLRHPPLPRPYFWPHSLICASIPRLIPLYPPLRTCATLTPSFTRFNRSPRRNNHNTCYPLTISAYLSRL